MLKATFLVLVSALTLTSGCSSSTTTELVDSGTTSKGDTGSASKGDTGGGGSSSSKTGCVLGSAADMDLSCSIEDTSGFSPAEISSLNTTCTQSPGTVVSTCPTAGLVGCCTTKIEGTYTMEACVYSGSAADGKAACTQQSGTWSTSE